MVSGRSDPTHLTDPTYPTKEMNDCRRIESLLPPYVDGDASSQAIAEVDAHLATCADCRTHVEASRTARAVLQARRHELAVTAPPGLRTRIVSSLTPAREPALGWFGRVAAFAAAASLALLLFTALEFVSPRSEALFAAQLAVDHVRCFIVHLGSIQGAAVADVQREFQERYGWSVPVPASNDAMGLTLVAARRCPFWLGSHAHLLYRNGPNELSLYVTPGESRPDGELHVLGHVERIWTVNGQVYALVGRGVPEGDFDRIASYLEAQTGRPN